MDIHTYITDFPYTVHEAILPEPDPDCYSVYINARDSREKQLEAYRHAIQHAVNDDFEKSDVQEIEADAHEPVGNSEQLDSKI